MAVASLRPEGTSHALPSAGHDDDHAPPVRRLVILSMLLLALMCSNEPHCATMAQTSSTDVSTSTTAVISTTTTAPVTIPASTSSPGSTVSLPPPLTGSGFALVSSAAAGTTTSRAPSSTTSSPGPAGTPTTTANLGTGGPGTNGTAGITLAPGVVTSGRALEWYHYTALVAIAFAIIIATCYALLMWQQNALRLYTAQFETFLKDVGLQRRLLAKEVEKTEEARAAAGLPTRSHMDYEVPAGRIRKTRKDKETEQQQQQQAGPSALLTAGSLWTPPASTAATAQALMVLQKREERELMARSRDVHQAATIDGSVREAMAVHRNLQSLRRTEVHSSASVL